MRQQLVLNTLLLGGLLSACGSLPDQVISHQSHELQKLESFSSQDPVVLSARLDSRASGYRAKGQYELALADHNRALELNPGHFSMIVSRARTYLADSQFDKAQADLDTALAIYPENYSALELKRLADAKVAYNSGHPFL